MSKVYVELICDDDVAIELLSYPSKRVDVITYNNNPDVIIEMGGERYREELSEKIFNAKEKEEWVD